MPKKRPLTVPQLVNSSFTILAGHNPSQKEAGEETANGKEYLSRNEIEHIEKILAANAQPI